MFHGEFKRNGPGGVSRPGSRFTLLILDIGTGTISIARGRHLDSDHEETVR
jgi:hypothetical protein